MRVRFRNAPRESYPANEAPFAPPTQTNLSANKEYEAYAVSVYNGVTFVQVINDVDNPRFYPRVLFDVIDPSLPQDWICNTFPEGPVQLVMGPEFMAKDLAAYDAMIESRSPQFEAFWERINWGRPQSDEDDDD